MSGRLWEVEGLVHSCRCSLVSLKATCTNAVRITYRPKRYHTLLVFHVSLSFMSKRNTHTRIQKHTLFPHSERALGGRAPKHWEKRKKESATEDVRLYLSYGSFEICWCAPSQPSLDSARLDEKHFYWALWEGQMPQCVCVFVGKSVNRQATLAMSSETLVLSRVRW